VWTRCNKPKGGKQLQEQSKKFGRIFAGATANNHEKDECRVALDGDERNFWIGTTVEKSHVSIQIKDVNKID